MDLKNCAKCGRVFAYKGNPICSRCLNNNEEDFKKVKEYLYDYPGATIPEVAEATGVSEKQILIYLRESRIEIREDSNCFLDCQRCGVSIKSGRFCEKCTLEMQKEFTQAVRPQKQEQKDEKKSKQKDKMYITEIRKKNK